MWTSCLASPSTQCMFDICNSEQAKAHFARLLRTFTDGSLPKSFKGSTAPPEFQPLVVDKSTCNGAIKNDCAPPFSHPFLTAFSHPFLTVRTILLAQRREVQGISLERAGSRLWLRRRAGSCQWWTGPEGGAVGYDGFPDS